MDASQFPTTRLTGKLSPCGASVSVLAFASGNLGDWESIKLTEGLSTLPSASYSKILRWGLEAEPGDHVAASFCFNVSIGSLSSLSSSPGVSAVEGTLSPRPIVGCGGGGGARVGPHKGAAKSMFRLRGTTAATNPRSAAAAKLVK